MTLSKGLMELVKDQHPLIPDVLSDDDIKFVMSTIKEYSTELQKGIKSVLKRTADLNTKNINIRIKNISNKKSKKSDANENREKKVKKEEV